MVSDGARDAYSAEVTEARRPEGAYDIIREAILNGTLPSGSHLSEERLTQMTETSRTPVRDALGKLANEGLVRIEGRHRFVGDFSAEQITIIFNIRMSLEGYAVRLACEHITTEELSRLHRLVEAMDRAIEAGGDDAGRGFYDLNREFHQQILDATRSWTLISLATRTLSVPLHSLKQDILGRPVNMLRSNAQHKEILEALDAGNADWASAAMTAHIISSRP